MSEIKLNPPSLSRPQDPANDETQTYVWQLDWVKKRYYAPFGQEVPIEEKEYTHDAVFGHVVIPEYQNKISFPIEKLNWKDKLKMKLAAFILWLANRIGDKNV